MFGLHKLYSKQSLLRFLWKKVHRLEKSTPTPLVALQTNISYALGSLCSIVKTLIVSGNGPRDKVTFKLFWTAKINLQSLEDTQVGYISQKYTLDKYTFNLEI